MDPQIAIVILVILVVCVLGMAGILVLLIMLWKKLAQILKRYAGKRTDLEQFNDLREDYKTAIDRIVMTVLGNERPDMNDAFRAWQAGLCGASIREKDKKPDLKQIELEALVFRDGWESREQTLGPLL